MFKQILYIGLLLAGCHTLVAQPAKPWTKREFPPIRGNYEFRMVSGKTETEAFQMLSQELCRESGLRVTGSTVVRIESNARNENEQLSAEFTIDCEGQKVWCYKVDEYRATDGTLFFLYQISKRGDFTPHFPNYELVDDFNKTTAVALSFVPFGVAQFYKGSTTKGIWLMAGQIATIGGASYAYLKHNDYYNLAKTDPSYKYKAQDMATLYHGFLITAFVVYGVGVIDGIMSKGRKRYVLQNNHRLGFTPHITPHARGTATGVSIQFKF